MGNPVPAVASLSPGSLPAGSPPQPLTVNGTGFVSSSTVNYNGQNRATTFVSSTKLTIQLTSTDLATSGSYPVYVTNPSPQGGTSNIVDFTVTAGSGGNTPTITPPILPFMFYLRGDLDQVQPVTFTVNCVNCQAGDTLTQSYLFPPLTLPSGNLNQFTFTDYYPGGIIPV